MDSKVISINGCHDASVTFVDKNNQLRIFEYERFCKVRYGVYRCSYDGNILGTSKKVRDEFVDYIRMNIKEEPEILLCSELDENDIRYFRTKFRSIRSHYQMGHHMSHCAGAYYQSGFDEALVFSYDGGGLDYSDAVNLNMRSYTVCKAEGTHIEVIDHNFSLGYAFNPGIYGVFAYYISDVKKEKNEAGQSDKMALTYAGKLMGLAAYGEVRKEWIDPVKQFFMHNPTDYEIYGENISKDLEEDIGITLYENCFSGKDAYDFAATIQYVFEDICFSFIQPYIDKYNMNVVFSGGCAMNVLFNQKMYEYLDSKGLKFYVPPYPGDCGLSFGHFLYYQQLKYDPSPYCGIDILDRDKLKDYYQKYESQGKVLVSTTEKIVDLIKEGKIGAIIQGYSEVGPRALGNRSIICDPSFPDMKDVINAKVKFREWYRPFAPVCREEDKDIYFDNAFPSEYMSFAPLVKDKYRKLLPSITHEDGSARLQTVKYNQHKLFYDILTELRTRGEIGVIMNTSFNIKGKPILSTIEDSFYVLENTELDFLVVENLLFVK
jgi:carbamoyltransferase